MTGIEVKSWEARELDRSTRLTIVVEKWAAGCFQEMAKKAKKGPACSATAKNDKPWHKSTSPNLTPFKEITPRDHRRDF